VVKVAELDHVQGVVKGLASRLFLPAFTDQRFRKVLREAAIDAEALVSVSLSLARLDGITFARRISNSDDFGRFSEIVNRDAAFVENVESASLGVATEWFANAFGEVPVSHYSLLFPTNDHRVPDNVVRAIVQRPDLYLLLASDIPDSLNDGISGALFNVSEQLPTTAGGVRLSDPSRPNREAYMAGGVLLRAWRLAVLVAVVAVFVYDNLDDLVDDRPAATAELSIELVSVENLDAPATTGLAQSSERFLGLFNLLIQSGDLDEFDQVRGEHNLRQYLGEMQNPEGAAAHVVRGYEMKMIEIYHRHIGIEGLRLVADDETVERVESAISQAVEMGAAEDPEVASTLAEPIPETLEPSPSKREKLTTAIGWGSGAAISATVGGAGVAKLIDGLGELGKILPAPWGAMIGAILGLLAYTFKPKGKP
jgi:hypothetical protein